MLHKTVLKQKSGFKALSDTDLGAVSGGGDIIVTGTRDDPWVESIYLDDLLAVGMDFGDLMGDDNSTPLGDYGDGGGSSSSSDPDDESLLDAIINWIKSFFQDEPDEGANYLPLSEDALGQILRDCVNAGGSWEITGSDAEGAVGYKVLTASGEHSYIHIKCTIPGG